MEGRIWLINHNGSADLHTPIHPPLLEDLFSGGTLGVFPV